MESFKLYLPSNASHEHFPNNTSSHYQTKLHEPIHLEGKWEVAAESVYYSANIDDEKEIAGVYFDIKAKEPRNVNDLYPFNFKVSPDEKWLGFYGVEIPMGDRVSKLIRDLNNANAILLTDQSQLFEFRLKEGRVTYVGMSPSFSLELHANTARILGFPNKVTFSGLGPFTGNVVTDDAIHYGPYMKHVFYFHHLLTHRKMRISIKLPGEEFDTKLFVAMWNERLLPHFNCRLEFNHEGKSILHLGHGNVAIILCPALAKAIDQPEPLIRVHTRWSYGTYNPTPSMKEEHWFVDIHSNELARTYIPREFLHEIIFRPRLFATSSELIRFLNDSVMHKLKKELNNMYDVSKHHFQLREDKSKERVTLDVGPWLTISWSSILSHMLGFDQHIFDKGSHLALKRPASWSDRMQRVLLMTDFIQPVSYGNKQLTVLQDFIHVVKGRNIIEKRFQPLSYVPIIRNHIDTITVKLVNEDETAIAAKDVKTVLVLHLKRVE